MKQCILLVGPPGSGKSTLAKQYEAEGYVYVNQDTQGKEHLHNFDMAVIDGQNVIVDRMNFSKMQRSRYLEIAKSHGYETKIVVLHYPRAECYKRIMTRENHPTIKDSSAANSALNTFFSKYEKPEPGEADNIQFIYPLGAKELAVIIDLDGTLCNIDHRLHFVKTAPGVKKNWKAFFENLSEDSPNEWCRAIYDQFQDKYPVVFASGRPDDHEKATKEWLWKNGFSTLLLYMRCRGDHRPDYIAKEIILDFEILTRFTPLFFVDDRKQVADLWRRRGYVCLQCAEGDF